MESADLGSVPLAQMARLHGDSSQSDALLKQSDRMLRSGILRKHTFMKLLTFDDQGASHTDHFTSEWHKRPVFNHHYDVASEGSHMTFSPDSKLIYSWHWLVALAVSQTLFATPFEIAMPQKKFGIWHYYHEAKLLANAVFMTDLLINFFVGFVRHSGQDHAGERLVLDRCSVASNYFRGWFWLDLVCAVPWDYFNYAILNIMRITKLWRVLGQLKLKQTSFFFMFVRKFRVLMLIKCFAVILFFSHVISCFWAGLAVSHPHEKSWLDTLLVTKPNLRPEIEQQPAKMYMWSMYYAITLVTTVGFGDVTPQTDQECIMCICCLCAGTLVWAYVLSSVIDAIQCFDPHHASFHKDMDELKDMMDEYELRPGLQCRVLEYFQSREVLFKYEQRGHFFQKMSVELRGRVTSALWEQDIRDIPFISHMFESSADGNIVERVRGSTQFVREMCQLFEMKVHARSEHISCLNLTIVHKGIVVVGMTVKVTGSIVGDDCFIVNPLNRMQCMAVALTNVCVLVTDASELSKLLKRYPAQCKVVRSYNNWMAMKRGTVRELHARAQSLALDATPRASPELSQKPRARRSMLLNLTMDDNLPLQRPSATLPSPRLDTSPRKTVESRQSLGPIASTCTIRTAAPAQPPALSARLRGSLADPASVISALIEGGRRLDAKLEEMLANQQGLEARLDAQQRRLDAWMRPETEASPRDKYSPRA